MSEIKKYRKKSFVCVFFILFAVYLQTSSASALNLIVATDQSLTFKDLFYKDARSFTLSLVDNLEIDDKFALVGFGDEAKLAFRPLPIESKSDRLWLKGRVKEHFPKPAKKVTFYKPAFELSKNIFTQWRSSSEKKTKAKVLLIITDDKGSDLNKTLPEESDINVPKIMKIKEARYSDYLVMARIYDGSYITTRFLNIPDSYEHVVAQSKTVNDVFQKLRNKLKTPIVDTNDKEIRPASDTKESSLMADRKRLFIAAGAGLILLVIFIFLLINRRGSVHEQDEVDEELVPLVVGIEKDGEDSIEEIELKRGDYFEISSKLTADLFIDDIPDGFSLSYDGKLLISPLILSDGIEVINEGELPKKLEGGEPEEIFFGTVINSGDYSIKVEGGEDEK